MVTQHQGQDTAHVSGAGRALGGPSQPKLCVVLRVELMQGAVCPPRDMVKEGLLEPPSCPLRVNVEPRPADEASGLPSRTPHASALSEVGEGAEPLQFVWPVEPHVEMINTAMECGLCSGCCCQSRAVSVDSFSPQNSPLLLFYTWGNRVHRG